jgi:hypothetical protein
MLLELHIAVVAHDVVAVQGDRLGFVLPVAA